MDLIHIYSFMLNVKRHTARNSFWLQGMWIALQSLIYTSQTQSIIGLHGFWLKSGQDIGTNTCQVDFIVTYTGAADEYRLSYCTFSC